MGFPSVISNLSDHDLNEYAEMEKDFACLNGVLKYPARNSPAVLQHTILPSPFPAKLYHQAFAVQTDFNLLYWKVAQDHEFLTNTLKPALTEDSYLSALWRIYEVDRELGPVQPIKLALSRSDYMVHVDNNMQSGENSMSLKQVEYNLIASGLGSISERLVDQHKLMLECIPGVRNGTLPPSPSAVGFARAMVNTHSEYVKSLKACGFGVSKTPAILMVVAAFEPNMFDQRCLELTILRVDPKVRSLRRTFSELSIDSGRVFIDSNKRLFVDDTEISLIYYRVGYSPAQFHEKTWETKEMLERTLAVKCPSIEFMLANTKLVQTALAQPGALTRFLGQDQETIDKLSATFARQTFLSTDFELASRSRIDSLIADCRAHPKDYVLKPQREGGGNNIFGEAVMKKIDEILGKPEATAYILMERFYPPPFENFVVGLNYPPPMRRQMISELGVFGVVLSKGDEILENYDAGYLFRSKFEGDNEGGVATGTGCIDTPYLI